MIFAEFTEEFNNVQVESLYQWDEGEELKISGIDFGSTAPQVHFCNKKSETAIAVQGVLRDDGSVIASVPNSLLTEPYDITAYVHIKTAVSSNTIKCIVIPVIARKMPSDYVLTTDRDIVEIHEIELEAKAIIDNLTASEYSSTTSYKRPNIVYYNNSAYMCKSYVAVTGVDPTDTTVWQLLCKDTSVSSVALNSSGDLVFTFDNGTSKTVAIPTISPDLIETVQYATNAEKTDFSNNSWSEEVTQLNPVTGLSLIEVLVDGKIMVLGRSGNDNDLITANSIEFNHNQTDNNANTFTLYTAELNLRMLKVTKKTYQILPEYVTLKSTENVSFKYRIIR